MQVTLASLLGLGATQAASPGAQKPAAHGSPKSGGKTPEPTAIAALDEALITLLLPWQERERTPPTIQLNNLVPGAKHNQPNAVPEKPDGDEEVVMPGPSIGSPVAAIEGGHRRPSMSNVPTVAPPVADPRPPILRLRPSIHLEGPQHKPSISPYSPTVSIHKPTVSSGKSVDPDQLGPRPTYKNGEVPGLPPVLRPRPTASSGESGQTPAVDTLGLLANGGQKPKVGSMPEASHWFNPIDRSRERGPTRAIAWLEKIIDRLPAGLRKECLSLRDAGMRLIKAGVPHTEVLKAVSALIKSMPVGAAEHVKAKLLSDAVANLNAIAKRIEEGAPPSLFAKSWRRMLPIANPWLKGLPGMHHLPWSARPHVQNPSFALDPAAEAKPLLGSETVLSSEPLLVSESLFASEYVLGQESPVGSQRLALAEELVGQVQGLDDAQPVVTIPNIKPETQQLTAEVTPRSEAIVVRPSELVEQVKQLLDQATSRTVTLRLDPPELGSIDLTVTTVGSRVEANFVASSPEARAVLEANRPILVQALQSRGLELGAMHIGDQRRNQDVPQRWSNVPGWRIGPLPEVRIAPAPIWWRTGTVDYTV